MVPKERLMTALHKGKPDRLPISVHQWQAYHLKYYLNGISALEAFQKFGMDAQIQYFGDVGQSALVDYDFTKFSTPEWQRRSYGGQQRPRQPDGQSCHSNARGDADL